MYPAHRLVSVVSGLAAMAPILWAATGEEVAALQIIGSPPILGNNIVDNSRGPRLPLGTGVTGQRSSRFLRPSFAIACAFLLCLFSEEILLRNAEHLAERVAHPFGLRVSRYFWRR
jgi:hypothetical protein